MQYNIVSSFCSADAWVILRYRNEDTAPEKWPRRLFSRKNEVCVEILECVDENPGMYGRNCKYEINLDMPKWKGGKAGEEKKIIAAYRKAISLAVKKGCRDVLLQFPGAFFEYPEEFTEYFPKRLLAALPVDEDITVILVNPSCAVPEELSKELDSLGLGRRKFAEFEWDEFGKESSGTYFSYADSSDYILPPELIPTTSCFSAPVDYCAVGSAEDSFADSSAADSLWDISIGAPVSADSCCGADEAVGSFFAEDLDDMLNNMDAGFTETLLSLIDRSGKKDSEIYRKANISRQHFSKIRSNPLYRPTKPTAIAFAVALELDLEQTKDLIGRAGYALTASSRFDVIVSYFINRKNYNLFDINNVLFSYDESLLGV